MQDIELDSKIQILYFLVQGARMCAYLKNIQKVLPLAELTAVPSSPNYFAGMLNIKGRAIPVIDLALKTGLHRNEMYTLNSSILLCTDGEQEVGLIVDKIIELADIDKSTFQMQEKFNHPNSPFLASIVQDKESALLVNINAVLKTDLIEEKYINEDNDER